MSCGHPAAWCECPCGRGRYCPDCYSSCYPCYLDRRDDQTTCVFCGAWHSAEFDTCYQCRPQRDDAGRDLRLVIIARDGAACRYCGAAEGETQADPRLVRPRCPADCLTEHRHRYPCRPGCDRRHQHLRDGDGRTCAPDCDTPHQHLARDDDGIRPVTLHVDHIQPCASGGTADPWNLQVLCGVCNVAKGADWIPGSRHHRARLHLMAAYLTYLDGWLDNAERVQLRLDADDEGLTLPQALRLTAADYGRRARARRPQWPERPGRCGNCAAPLPPGYAGGYCEPCEARPGYDPLGPAPAADRTRLHAPTPEEAPPMTQDTPTTSWDTGRRRECGNLLRAIATDAGTLADQTADPDDRRTLRIISRDAGEFATTLERYGVGPQDPRRVAEWAADLEDLGDPAATWGAELYQLAGQLRMFYVPDMPADHRPAGTGQPPGLEPRWNTNEQETP